MSFSPDSIFSAPPVEVHAWMEITTPYFSLVPPPYLFVVFVLFLSSALLARHRKASIMFGALLAAVLLMRVGIGIPFLPNLPIHGLLLTFVGIWWLLTLFRDQAFSAPPKIMAVLAILTLMVFYALGFPFTVSFDPVPCRSNVKNLSTAVEMYETDHKAYPSQLEELFPDYLRKAPSCPQSPRNSYTIELLDSGRVYAIRCNNPIHELREEWKALNFHSEQGFTEE